VLESEMDLVRTFGNVSMKPIAGPENPSPDTA